MWADAACGIIVQLFNARRQPDALAKIYSYTRTHQQMQKHQRRVGWYRFGSTGTIANSIAHIAHTNFIEFHGVENAAACVCLLTIINMLAPASGKRQVLESSTVFGAGAYFAT